MPKHRTAIIGAGIAGLALARRLTDAGRDVVVFDRARGLGGRAGTRRVRGLRIDHGAQYFIARDEDFLREVTGWEQRGVVERWPKTLVSLRDGEATPVEDGEVRYRGADGMSAVCRALADNLALRPRVRIRRVICGAEGWELQDGTGEWYGPFVDVAVAVPAPQAVSLLSSAPEFARRVEAIGFEPCWAGCFAFVEPLGAEFDAAFLEERGLRWAARRSYAGGESWVVHADATWTTERLDVAADDVLPELREALAGVLGCETPEPTYERAHLWRHARPTEMLGENCLWDSMRRLGACGDWCIDARFEAGWLSGVALAERMLAD